MAEIILSSLGGFFSLQMKLPFFLFPHFLFPLSSRFPRTEFSEENMDGRKRFTFPWSQKHREILKEFPRHSFDSKTNGRKFEYQPRIRLTPKRSTPTPPRAAADTVTPTNRQSSLPESFSVEDKNRDMQCHVSPSTRDQEIKSQEVSLSTVGKNMERKG